MAEFDKAVWQRLTSIVAEEKRLFGFCDFLSLDVNEIRYQLKYGTFWNKISTLIREDNIERTCNSCPGYYTIKGYTFGRAVKKMSVNTAPIVDRSANVTPFEIELALLPEGVRSLHNIHLKFRVSEIWPVVRESGALRALTLHDTKSLGYGHIMATQVSLNENLI